MCRYPLPNWVPIYLKYFGRSSIEAPIVLKFPFWFYGYISEKKLVFLRWKYVNLPIKSVFRKSQYSSISVIIFSIYLTIVCQYSRNTTIILRWSKMCFVNQMCILQIPVFIEITLLLSLINFSIVISSIYLSIPCKCNINKPELSIMCIFKIPVFIDGANLQSVLCSRQPPLNSMLRIKIKK